MTPSPEQPEHEEARRLAKLWLFDHKYRFTTDEARELAAGLLRRDALLSKAEQERDDNQDYRDRYRTALNAAVQRETDVKRELKAAERELERLREDLHTSNEEAEALREALLTWENYDLALRDGRQEDAAHFYEAMVEKFDAFSADTPAQHQREPYEHPDEKLIGDEEL